MNLLLHNMTTFRKESADYIVQLKFNRIKSVQSSMALQNYVRDTCKYMSCKIVIWG